MLNEVVVELVNVTCWCGMPHAVPAELRDKQKRDHANGKRQTAICCPLGHRYVISGESKCDQLEAELKRRETITQRERQRHDQTRAELRQTQRSLIAQKGVTTRLKNRAKNGVCPCCNRHFKNLARHMASQHPEFAAEGEE